MRENGKYRVLHACYWMLINVVFGYIAFYLANYGYSAGEIGMLSAAFAAVSAICQPVLGRVADVNRRWGWKTQILFFSIICCGIFVILFFVKHPIMVGLLFGIVILLVNCMQPMLNAACFYYEERGICIDFGFARGIGSLAYACMSSVLGYLTVQYGNPAVLFAGIPVFLLQIIIVYSMPYGSLSDKEKLQEKNIAVKSNCENSNANVKTNITISGFMKRYPTFCLMILGSILLISVHNFMTTYLLKIMESVGGNSSHMGMALAIGAVTEIPVLLLFSKIVKKISVPSLLMISGVAYIGKSLMFFLAGNVEMIYAAHLLQPLSYGLYASASIYFTNECMLEEDKITGQSLMTMTAAIGSVVGNLVGGWLIDFSGVKSMMGFSSVLSVVAAGVVITAARKYKKSRIILN